MTRGLWKTRSESLSFLPFALYVLFDRSSSLDFLQFYESMIHHARNCCAFHQKITDSARLYEHVSPSIKSPARRTIRNIYTYINARIR